VRTNSAKTSIIASLIALSSAVAIIAQHQARSTRITVNHRLTKESHQGLIQTNSDTRAMQPRELRFGSVVCCLLTRFSAKSGSMYHQGISSDLPYATYMPSIPEYHGLNFYTRGI
jgi:hypothetical protein